MRWVLSPAHIGGELAVDIDEAAVLGYQENRLYETASSKSINGEVTFLLHRTR
jgi:hypothetical protein